MKTREAIQQEKKSKMAEHKHKMQAQKLRKLNLDCYEHEYRQNQVNRKAI